MEPVFTLENNNKGKIHKWCECFLSQLSWKDDFSRVERFSEKFLIESKFHFNRQGGLGVAHHVREGVDGK